MTSSNIEASVSVSEVRVDDLRAARTGLPEVVFGEGKTPEQCVRALTDLLDRDVRPAIVSRVDDETASRLLDATPNAVYDSVARTVTANHLDPGPISVTVAIVCAGTSDLPVARECASILDAFGVPFDLTVDVGVAGLHRFVEELPHISAADITIVVAGMEGALPTVVAGLVEGPVIAVPTSVGYGASFEGVAALLSMLSACSPGITVVNIDNGLGAAMAALRIIGMATDGGL